MKVWLSRSRPGADRQAADLRAAGHGVVVAPVTDVEALPRALPPGSFDLVIFLSEHAVRCGLAALQSRPWFGRARVLAVGARTAEVLARHGVAAEAPAGAGSEGLLALPPLRAVRERRVLLVAGEGGRPVLGDTLTRRGAEVRRFDCYRRVAATDLAASVQDCDAIIAASAEGLERVAAVWLSAGGRADVPVLVPSPRVAGRGVELGLCNLHDCGGADSAAWLRGLSRLDPEAR